MNNSGKKILFIIVVLYVLFPLDFAPGPIDDALVLLLGLSAAKNQRY